MLNRISSTSPPVRNFFGYLVYGGLRTRQDGTSFTTRPTATRTEKSINQTRIYFGDTATLRRTRSCYESVTDEQKEQASVTGVGWARHAPAGGGVSSPFKNKAYEEALTSYEKIVRNMAAQNED